MGHSVEKKAVIKAIGDLGRRVTPADVSTKTGLPYLVVQQELNKVAEETKGHLQVGTTGDIVYSFQPGFSNQYLARGVKAAFLVFFANAMAAGFYVLRISFGVALILSLVIGFIALIAICLALMFGGRGGSSRDDDRDGGLNLDWIFNGGGGGFHFSFWDWMVLRDILWWNATTSPSYQPRYDYNRPTIRTRQRSSFLLNCFSFLFGDGDPNEGLSEKRWQIIAQVIKRHNNVVTAEHLAPYTGVDPKNEDGVLPVLVRFNGRPEVTPSGNIVYVFDSLQSIATEQSFDPPSYLQEFPWKFTNVKDGELVPVYVVAAINLGVVYTVWHMLLTSPFGRIPFATLTFDVLLGYAVAFIAVPLWRSVWNALRNQKIDARNTERLRYGQAVQNPSAETLAKLVEARSFKLTDRKIKDSDVIFTTENDARDQSDDLTEKFDELSKKKSESNASDRALSEPDGESISMAPPVEDEGKVIDIRKYKKEL